MLVEKGACTCASSACTRSSSAGSGGGWQARAAESPCHCAVRASLPSSAVPAAAEFTFKGVDHDLHAIITC